MWLYLFQHRHEYAIKIGITRRKLKKRVAEVSRDEPCRFIFAVPLLFNHWFEKLLHRHYKHLHRKDLTGEEWFYFWLPFRPMFWLIVFFLAQATMFVFTIWLLVGI